MAALLNWLDTSSQNSKRKMHNTLYHLPETSVMVCCGFP